LQHGVNVQKSGRQAYPVQETSCTNVHISPNKSTWNINSSKK